MPPAPLPQTQAETLDKGPTVLTSPPHCSDPAKDPESRPAPPPLQIEISPPWPPQKHNEGVTPASPLTPSDDEETPRELPLEAINPGDQPEVVSAVGMHTRSPHPRISEEGTEADADGSDEEQAVDELAEETVESQPRGKKRKGKTVSTTPSVRNGYQPQANGQRRSLSQTRRRRSLARVPVMLGEPRLETRTCFIVNTYLISC